MRYFFVNCLLHHGGDDMCTNDKAVTMTIEAPNKLAAIHVLGKMILDLSFTEKGRQKALWDIWESDDFLSFHDASVSINKLTEMPYEHFVPTSLYLESHAYNYDDMIKYGNYQDVFSKESITNPAFDKILLLPDELSREVNLAIADSKIGSISLSPVVTEEFKVEFAFDVTMKAGGRYTYGMLFKCKDNERAGMIETGHVWSNAFAEREKMALVDHSDMDDGDILDKILVDQEYIRDMFGLRLHILMQSYTCLVVKEQINQK